MFDFLKSLFGMHNYMTSLKPCPGCGGRHIWFKPSGPTSFHRIICDDCGFAIENLFADRLLNDWERIPRKKEDNHD